MKPRRFAAILAAALVSCAAATGASASGIVKRGLQIESPIVGRPIPYTVYEPAPKPAPGTRWPVLYLLHGGGGGADDWLDQGRIAETMDAEIKAGRVRPMMVVMPDGGGTSWFVDNPDPGGAGPVASALNKDFLNGIDSLWPTAACRGGRAIGGLSMGGYGAALFALDHPDDYAAAILLSPAIATPIDPGDSERIKRGQEFYDGAYGANFDYRRFNAWNVFPRVAAHAKRVDKPAFWITAGDQDGMGIITGSAEFHVALRRAGYETVLRIGAGHHDWTNWSQSIVPALEWLSPRLSAECSTG